MYGGIGVEGFVKGIRACSCFGGEGYCRLEGAREERKSLTTR